MTSYKQSRSNYIRISTESDLKYSSNKGEESMEREMLKQRVM